jgi:2'-5' RNA ligase
MKRDTHWPESEAVTEMRDLFGDEPNKTELQPENDLRIPGSVFFAIRLPDEAAGVAGACGQGLQLKYGLKGALLGSSRFHVTLVEIGAVPNLQQTDIDLACRIASALMAKRFVVAFDRVLSFRGKRNRPLVLLGDDGVAGLRLFRQLLVSELKRHGCPVIKPTQFEPHMTLLYDEIAVAEQTIEPVRWTVNDFVLIHSLQGRSQHVELGRWPLRA